MKKFGFPQTTVKEYDHWCVLLRQEQVTLGSLILICKHDVEQLSALPKEAFEEQYQIVIDIENTLSKVFQYDKINYLMLMMVDPHVHFHVIPRYSQEKEFNGFLFKDNGWPSLPKLFEHNELEPQLFVQLRNKLRLAINA